MNVLPEVPFLQDVLLPVVDVLVLSFVLFKGYQILVQTRAVQLLKGALVFLGLWLGAALLNLRTVLWVFGFLAPSIAVAFAVIFQPELRKIFTQLGQGQVFRLGRQTRALQVDAIVAAAVSLSEIRRGALLVIPRTVGLRSYQDTGTALDCILSKAIVVSLFAHDTPLHDGAIILEGNRIASAGCVLPLSEQLDIRRSFGTRHRAALGLAEESDAIILVVSEETGAVSLAYDANLHYDLPPEEVTRRLVELLRISPDDLGAEVGAEASGGGRN